MTVVNGVRLISNSEIQDFKQCPRKWWLAWYRGLAPAGESQTGVKHTGTRLHACLAEYYVPEGQRPVHPLETHQRLEEELLAAWNERVEDGIPDLSARAELAALQKDFALERVMLEGYMEWLAETGVDEDLEVIASEVYMQAPFMGKRYGNGYDRLALIGKLDTRTRNRRTGRLRFMDHKSRGNLTPGMLRQNPQMLHYHILEWLSAEEGEQRCDGALYNMLKRSKRTARAEPPFYSRLEIPHNQHELDSFKLQLAGSIENILFAEHELDRGQPHHKRVPPAPNDDTCKWKCPFVKICHMFDDGSRVEDALADRYTEIDPLSYYQGKEQGTTT